MSNFFETVNNRYVGKRCIIRCMSAGVFYATVVEICYDPRMILLVNSRRVWGWSGAASLSEITEKGVQNTEQCKFPVTIRSEHLIADWIEIMEVNPEAQLRLDSVPIWGYVK